MARRRAVRLVAVVAVVLLIAVAASLALDNAFGPIFGSAPNKRPEIQADLVQAAERVGPNGTVSFADVVPGDWDTVYIWDGYTADREHTVFPGVDFGDGGYGVDYVVAFAHGGSLMAWSRFNVNDKLVYFDPPGTGIKLSRDRAVFKVTVDPDRPAGFVLVPA